MKAYIYHTVFTFDKQKMDDYIFIELSKYQEGYPSDEAIASEWRDNVQEDEIDIVEKLCTWLDNGYELLEATR